MTLAPFEAGKDSGLKVETRSADVLWKGMLFSLPLEKFPLHLNAQIDPAAPSVSARLSLGDLRIEGTVDGADGIPRSATLGWTFPGSTWGRWPGSSPESRRSGRR